MSVDPLAAAIAGNADLAALIDAELAQLAADAQALRSLLVEDAVVTARVLPSNGLTDLLEIAGRRVAASLPPTVRPGDALQVRVTGFDGDRILLQIVATGAPAAVETGPPNAAPAIPPNAAPTIPPNAQPPPEIPAQSSFVPAPGAFVAASIRTAAPPAAPPPPAPVAQPAAPATAPPPAAPSTAGVSESPAPAAPAMDGPPVAPAQRPGIPPRAPLAAPRQPSTIEARVAAARASVPGAVAQSPPADETPPPAQPHPAAGGARFTLPPPIAQKGVPSAETMARRPAPAAYPAATRASGLAVYAEPVALLRALRLPVTPSNVSAAALALHRPERLPEALAALERALPSASDDPNVATLRTLLSFVGRIDPRSPALATQIAAYVDHVVDGAEPKIATLLAATGAAADPAQRVASAPGEPIAATAPHHPPSLPAALAAERGAALAADLKQTMLAVAANPATPDSVAPSLASALTALTAVQVSAAQTLAANPDGIAFTIPLTTPHGMSNAHISVRRDAPDGRGGARVDPQNFRIAFVLETAHYGVVAIDLVTVGREVTVDVRTEASTAMRAFRDALGTLTARLESLRYTVASAGASVGTTSTVAVEAPPSAPVDPAAAVDRSA